MLDIEKLETMGQRAGFTHVKEMRVDTLELLPEVRDMCSAGKCGKYDTNWCCPPAVGSLEECRQRLFVYRTGILVQTVGQLEDEWDGEGMMETQQFHKEAFHRLYRELKDQYPGLTAAGAGCCTRCKQCTYPEAPCRYPDYSFASMEAFGMLVSEVCRRNGLDYYYGKGTITYTSCFFLE